jgi:hypothetical protein
MTLPFEKDDGSRKWQCFVCGHQFTEFDEFKSHILSTHDEGREFVVCPLERCGAPVRDIRMHFKCKHPSEKAPKSGQMKALIWKDQKPQGKNGPGKGGPQLRQRKPKFREGYMLSNKNGGKEMHYRSGYECDVYECLEAMPDVVKYDVEPFAIKYSYQGEVHDYNPDLSIIFDDGRVEIWEIKPANQTHLEKNKAKWTACQQHCEARGWDFIVMTEVGIGKLKRKVQGYGEEN